MPFNSIQGLKYSLVSINRVFVEVLNEFLLKTFRDLDSAVIPGVFLATNFLNPISLVVVLYLISRVDLSK